MLAGDAAAVTASGQSVLAGNPATNILATRGENTLYQLQNGPDGRMYGASGYQSGGGDAQPGDDRNVFFVLGRPNARGFDCAVTYQRFDFGGRYGNPGLPNFMQHYFNGLEPAAGGVCDPGQTQLYPNPTTDAFRVQAPGDCAPLYTLTVYDALGRKVASQAGLAADGRTPVGVASLAPGWYVAELRSDQQVVTRNFVKL